MLAGPELKAVHPLGKSPVVVVEPEAADAGANTGAPNKLVIAETACIVEYLCEYWGKDMVPPRYRPGSEGRVGGESEEWVRYNYFMQYAEGSLMGYLVMVLVAHSMAFSFPPPPSPMPLLPCCFPSTKMSMLIPTPPRHPQRSGALLHQARHARRRLEARRDLHRAQPHGALCLYRVAARHIGRAVPVRREAHRRRRLNGLPARVCEGARARVRGKVSAHL